MRSTSRAADKYATSPKSNSKLHAPYDETLFESIKESTALCMLSQPAKTLHYHSPIVTFSPVKGSLSSWILNGWISAPSKKSNHYIKLPHSSRLMERSTDPKGLLEFVTLSTVLIHNPVNMMRTFV